MSDFERSFASLRGDQGKAALWTMICAGALLGAWLVWGVFAHVSLYEMTSDARVEMDGATYPVDSPFLGRIVTSNLRVGQHVRRGDLLVELDAMAEQLQLKEEQVRLQGIDPQIARLRSQIDSEIGIRTEEQRTLTLTKQEAKNRQHEAQMLADFAQREAERVRKLYEQHLVSVHEYEKSQNEAGRLKLTVSSLASATMRVPQEQAARERERDVRVARLQGEIASLESQRETIRADADRLNYEQERRRIRAPADGRIGEAANLRVGAVVSEGDRLGSIVPEGRMLIVAQYPARAAIGRIQVGQPATLRLAGFPWAEFGTVPARVSRVAEEVRDGKVRVELALADTSAFRGSLQHGMPGTVEVAVDLVSPLGLILRAAGQWLTKPS